MDQTEAMKKNYLSLLSEGEAALLYNFRSKSMQAFKEASNPFEVSAFLPSDEMYLGLFEDYRKKGLSDYKSLKSVYNFEFGEH